MEHFKQKQTNNNLVHKLLSDKIRDIESDRSSGASKLAQKALGVLKSFAHTNKNQTNREFIEEFSKLGRKLFEARPNMAPVQNLMAQIVYEVDTMEEHNLDFTRKFAASRIDKLRKQSENAVKKSAEHAATTIIANSDALATCSYSSTICEALQAAKQQGKSFKVFVAESRSVDNKFRYGQTLAKILQSMNIHTEVFPDNQIYRYVPRANRVLVGADSLLCDGSIINGSPSYELAVKAKECGIPFYSVCETAKANAVSYLGKNVEVGEGFDCVPPKLVAGIITENGVIDTNGIVEVMKEKAKFLEIFQPK